MAACARVRGRVGARLGELKACGSYKCAGALQIHVHGCVDKCLKRLGTLAMFAESRNRDFMRSTGTVSSNVNIPHQKLVTLWYDDDDDENAPEDSEYAKSIRTPSPHP